MKGNYFEEKISINQTNLYQQLPSQLQFHILIVNNSNQKIWIAYTRQQPQAKANCC